MTPPLAPRLALLGLVLASLAVPVRASGAVRAQDELEACSFAPPARWSTAGGCAARTGVSFAPAVRAEPIEAWKVTLRGPIEGEPIAADGQVLLSVREAPTRRAVQILDLASGRTLLHQTLPADVPLEPAIHDDIVAVRPEADRVDLYRVRTNRLLAVRTIRARESISAPLLVDGELYLRVDDQVQRYDIGRREPVWSTPEGEVWRGTPSVRGDGVYALRYDQRGNALPTVLARATGERRSESKAGHHFGVVPEREADARLFVLDRSVFLHYPLPVPTSDDKKLDYGRIARDHERLDEQAAGLNALLTDPTGWNDGWITLEEDTGTPRWTAARGAQGGLEVTVLADATNHAELTSARVPASRTGSIVYLGGLAADLTTGEILWKRAVPSFRPVPVGGYLLVVEEPSTLTALHEPPPVLSAAGQVVAAREAELDQDVTDGFAALAYQSLRLGDSALTARLLAQAIQRGAQGRTVDSTRDGLERLEKSRPKTADERVVAGLEQQKQALIAKPEAALLEAAGATQDPALRRGYLRAALERDPEDADAVAAVRALVPPDAPVARTFDALSWLDLLDAIAQTPIQFVRPTVKGTPSSPELARLQTEADEWRSDVNGYRTRRLFLIAPPDHPGAVARCLEVGELVCDVLEQIFAVPEGRTGPPMTMILYGTREEYIGESERDRSGPELALGWTAGHYSNAENLSRLYVPTDDAQLEQLLSVYAHELTHHWLATRAPFASRAADPKLPFWIVEGFASLVEELRLDVHARTWSDTNARAMSLDVVANAADKDLVPWASLLTLDHDTFDRLGREAKLAIPLTWRLGRRAAQSQTQLFYAQSAALCHYLFDSSPENRKRLTDYVAAWYARDPEKLDAKKAFGAELDALGRAAQAHARKVVGR